MGSEEQDERWDWDTPLGTSPQQPSGGFESDPPLAAELSRHLLLHPPPELEQKELPGALYQDTDKPPAQSAAAFSNTPRTLAQFDSHSPTKIQY